MHEQHFYRYRSGQGARLLYKPPERARIVDPIYSAFRRCCVSNPDLTSSRTPLTASRPLIRNL